MDTKEQIRLIRRLKNEGKLGTNRAAIVSAVEANRNALFCEKVGYILKNVPAQSWETPEQPPLRTLKAAVLSSFTCEAYPLMLPPLLLCEDVWPEVYAAGYNQYVYELMNANSGLYRFSPQLTVCLLDERTVMEELPPDWNDVDLELACERKLEQINELLAVFHKQNKGLLVLHTIPLTAETYNLKIDYKTKAQISRIWRTFNNGLLDLSREWSQVITLDTEVLLQQYHVSRLYDPRLMHYGSFNLGEEVLFALAEECVKAARAMLGKAKKALVLDLDNTLWGGIIGDDGISGVQLGDTAPGNIFVEFQKAIRQLKNQGVLLTVSSKNEEAAVREMFGQHPDMQISLDDIVMLKANWEPKHENIKEIAKALNIGLDSLVFIDDNPFERNLVRDSISRITVPEMPNDPAYARETLLSAGWFNTIKLTATDLDRTSQYKTELKRERLKQSSGSMEDYLHSLNIEVKLIPANDFHLPRLAQLTVRTNQFNMTTRRYQEAEIGHMERSGRYLVIGFQTSDRFGDYGLIGCVLVEKLDQFWRIDNFMMSCRVFSRKIETMIIRHVLCKAKEAGMQAVFGDYIPTAKNAIVKDFYAQHGFEPAEPDAQALDGAASQTDLQLFVHRLQKIPEEVSWIKLHSEEEVSVI